MKALDISFFKNMVNQPQLKKDDSYTVKQCAYCGRTEYQVSMDNDKNGNNICIECQKELIYRHSQLLMITDEITNNIQYLLQTPWKKKYSVRIMNHMFDGAFDYMMRMMKLCIMMVVVVTLLVTFIISYIQKKTLDNPFFLLEICTGVGIVTGVILSFFLYSSFWVKMDEKETYYNEKKMFSRRFKRKTFAINREYFNAVLMPAEWKYKFHIWKNGVRNIFWYKSGIPAGTICAETVYMILYDYLSDVTLPGDNHVNMEWKENLNNEWKEALAGWFTVHYLHVMDYDKYAQFYHTYFRSKNNKAKNWYQLLCEQQYPATVIEENGQTLERKQGVNRIVTMGWGREMYEKLGKSSQKHTGVISRRR